MKSILIIKSNYTYKIHRMINIRQKYVYLLASINMQKQKQCHRCMEIIQVLVAHGIILSQVDPRMYQNTYRAVINPFTPRTIENQEAPNSKITRHCSLALARQQCPGWRQKRLFLIKIKC